MFFRRNRALSVIVVLSVMAAVLLSACGQSKESVFRVGVDDTYPPMEYKDDKNNTVGFDIDLANEIGKRLNKKVEFISNDWTGIFRALETDRFDAIISSVSRTDDRLNDYEMTRPYIANAKVIVVRPDNDSIKEPKDLEGKTVGVQIETTADEACQKYREEISFKLQQYDQVIQPFQDLKAGRLDAVVVDEVVARYYVNLDNKSYKVSSAKLNNEPIAICFKKGNTELRDKVDKILDDMRADGTLKKLSEKWFGEDLTSNIDEEYRDF